MRQDSVPDGKPRHLAARCHPAAQHHTDANAHIHADANTACGSDANPDANAGLALLVAANFSDTGILQ